MNAVRTRSSIDSIVKLDLLHFPLSEYRAQVPGKVVLMDNLDDCVFDEDAPRPTFPIRTTMSLCILCLAGQIDLDIDLKQYSLTECHVALVVPGSFLQLREARPDTKCVCVAMAPDFIRIIGDVKTNMSFGKHIKECPVCRFSSREMDEYISLYKLLKCKLLQDDYPYKEEVASSFLRIMQCNVKHYLSIQQGDICEKRAPTGRREELFVKFMSFVEANYLLHRNVVFYADRLCVSPKYLSTVIHAVSGRSAVEWINQYVVLEAKTLLRSGNMSVKDVSNRLNFANQSFFAKFFKQHTGYTPKEYKSL